MGDLEKVKNGQFNGIRRNDVARQTGEQMTSSQKNWNVYADKYQSIEPSLKDRLLND